MDCSARRVVSRRTANAFLRPKTNSPRPRGSSGSIKGEWRVLVFWLRNEHHNPHFRFSSVNLCALCVSALNSASPISVRVLAHACRRPRHVQNDAIPSICLRVCSENKLNSSSVSSFIRLMIPNCITAVDRRKSSNAVAICSPRSSINL